MEELNAELRSDKVTRRKAALKQLETHLASVDLAKLLDRTTLQLDAGLGGDVKLTWAGLCSSLMQCVSAEIHASANKKAPANKLVTGILRRLVATAEDPKRRARVGVVAPLLRRAGKLFAHVLEILRHGPPDFATEYTHTLRALLAEPRYCARVKASVYEELVDLHKERLASALAAAANDDADDAGAGREGDAANRTAQTFLELLRRCPHDMSPRGELYAVVTFLGSALAGLADANQLEGHLPVTLAQALNACLTRGGPDLAPATTLARLARDLRPLVDKALLVDVSRVSPRGGVHGDAAKKQKQKRGPQRTRLGEAVVTTCRLLLALGGTRACPAALSRLAATLERAIAAQPEASAADIDGGNGNADLALEPARAAACALAADVFAAQCSSPGAEGRWTSSWVGDAVVPSADASAAVGEKRGRADARGSAWDGDGDGILARARRRRIEGDEDVVVDADDGNDSAEPVMVRLGALASRAGASSWGPVVCAALIRHAAAIPPRLIRAWLDGLSSALVETVAAGAAADRAVAARAVWLARCLRELSAVERRGRARRPTRWQAEAGDTADAWMKVRACLTQWLPTFAPNETLTAEALATFAAASAPELAPGGPAPPHPKFWKLRAMSTSATDDADALVPPSTAALRAAAAATATGGARKEKANWHKARLGWILLRLRPPPPGERINFYRRRGGDGDPGAGTEPMRAVIAATRAMLLNAPLEDELEDVGDDGGGGGPRRRFWSREWVQRPRFGSDEWAAEEALEETDERAAPLFAAPDADGRFGDDDEDDEEETETLAPRGSRGSRARAGRFANARNTGVVAPSAPALAETATLFVETLRMIPAEGPVAALRVATVAVATASEIVATRRASRTQPAGSVSSRSARDVADDWAPTGAVLAGAADAVVAAARALREASAAAFRGDGDSNGDAGTNLAALDDACQLASEALPVAARAGLLDDVGDSTRTTLHDATRELVAALAAVAADAADAASVEARRARDAADGFLSVEGGAGGDAARDDEMFDDDLDAMPASRFLSMAMTQGGAPSTYLATQLARATPPSAQTLPSVGASPDGADASASAADAAALAALAAVSAIGATFPAAAAAAAAALLERVVEPVEARPPEEDQEDEEQTEGMVCVLVGGERVADAATRALCALSGTDASEEPETATGAKGMGVADLADRAIAGLEAALVGPSGRSGADDAVDRAPEERRAWLLTHTAALAEGLLRRRQRRRRRGRRRAGDPSAAAATAVAARRRGLGPRDVASVAAESSQTARLYPRLRFLVEDIAGLPNCVDLENNGVGDAKKFAPASLRAPASRAALSRALRALLELDPDYFQPPLAGALVALLEDDSGAVRRAAGRDIARVLAVFEPSDQPGILREKIARRLRLCVALPEPDALGRQTREDDEEDEDEDDEDEKTTDPVAREIKRDGVFPVDAPSGKTAPVFSADRRARLVGGAAAEASAVACEEETAMFTLGHLAAACPAVEARCVFLLVAHAAAKARDGAKNACGAPRARVVARAADILSRLAQGLGYDSRRAFLMRHSRTVGALWIRAEMSPHRLFRLFHAAGPAGSARGAGARDAGERLARLSTAETDAWEKAIVAPAVLAGDARAVRAASDAHWRRVGRGDVANTLRACIAPVVAHLFLARSASRASDPPDSAGPEEKARAAARRRLAEAAARALGGPLLARAGTENRSVDVLAFGALAAIASEMMLLTQCPHDGDAVRAPTPSGRVDSSCAEAEALAPPYRTPDEVVRAGLALPEAARAGLASFKPGRAASARDDPSDDAPSAWTGDAARRCVAALHAELCASRHPRHRKRAFAGLEALRRVLGDDAYRPFTARQLCHVALPHVGDRFLGPCATRFLEGVFGGPVARRDWSAVPGGTVGPGADALADALQPAVSTLVAAAERGDERGRRRAADAATKLLASLVGGAGAEGQAASVRAAAAALTPLPRHLASLSAEVVEAHARVTRATAMADRLRALVERAPRLAPETRALALRDGIREALERSREIREGGAPAARDAWRLAALAADAGDASLVARAGELLATLGPFATEGLDDDGPRREAASASASDVGAVVDPSDPALAAAVLRRLSGLMCDASAETTRAAAEDARDVLAAKSARAVLLAKRGDAFLSPLEREYLAPLAPAASLGPDEAERLALGRALAAAREARTAARAPAPSVEDRRTWVPGDAAEEKDLVGGGGARGDDESCDEDDGLEEDEPPRSAETRRYDAWIRRVVDALIEHCDSPLLRLARRAARAHASLAELLLPAAFVDIASKHPERGEVHAAVSEGVKLCLEADGGGCARATRTLLGALDAMRFRSAAAMRRPPASDAKRSSSEAKAAKAAKREPSPPEGWRRVYWVEVDYLVAAKAARRARAPLTATLLTEAWLEDRHGTVSLDEAAAAEDAAADVASFAAKEERVPEHVGLLLESQASLSEPDGIYGLLRSNALPVQMRLYEHEGAWGQALAGFDQGARARRGDGETRAKLMDVLRQMGCLHVLDVYVNALPPEEAATPQATAARFEAAWRVGQWDRGDDAERADAADAGSLATRALGLDRAGPPRSGVSERRGFPKRARAYDADDDASRAEAEFHRDLHAALAALRAGDVASTSSRLDAIRGALVRRATTEGVEARDASRTAVIRLRMLDDVADAAKLWRAYRGERDGATGSASDAGKVAAQAARSARDTWRRRVGALAEQSFRIAEPLLAVHGVLLRELGDDEALVAHLAETASLARKAGESAEGLRAIHQARALAAARAEEGSPRAAAPEPAALRWEPDDHDPRGFARHAMSSPLARWRLEEAKLLWASGRDQMAIGVGRHLLEATSPGVLAKLRLGGSGGAADRRGSESTPSQHDGAHQDPRFYETACLVSKWQGATRTESSRAVLQQHASIVRGVNAASLAARNGELRLPPSSRNVRPGAGHVARMLRRAHLRLAQFADQLYAQLEARLTSPEWAQSEALRRRNEQELQALEMERAEKRERLTRRAQLTREEAAALDEEQRMFHRRIFPLDKQVRMDRDEERTLRLDRVRWLVTALQAYRRTLEAGGARGGAEARGAAGADQKVVFRIVDIWFTVCGGADRLRTSGNGLTAQSEGVSIVERTNEEVAKLVARAEVPSSNFLPLSYQICGRLGTAPVAGNAFPDVLRRLVDRMCAEHPYHALYHVQALRRGDQVGGSGTSELYSTPREKIDAARDCLDAFARHSKHHAAMVREMDVMIEAYVDLARHPVSARDARGGDGGHQIPAQCKKRALRDLRLVPIITASLPVDPTMRYADGSFPHFVRFADTCRLVGGINQPKLVEALGSDGVAYKQLAKAGNDDLRQDAVMQQLFELVNCLLLANLATRERKLRVGTYRVVPLTPAAGVLEWVDNTTLLSEYLLGGGAPGDAGNKTARGAHERYRPRDLKHRECRDRLAACHTREELRSAYDEVCARFKPVMHHFFLENFPSPRAWWESRLTYTRSVAVNSMVGHVAGLGDRHSSNILLDKTSAEMIHIDLGVAFEQGKCLKTPETVPFRLTRDVVDGFGACGVEGVMRRCSEETMRVLRANKNALTTVVAVLVHDPILKWAVSPERAAERQREMEEEDEPGGGGETGRRRGEAAAALPAEGNLDAERALMRVAAKLDGYEGSEIRSVAGQVQQLLQDAQDPDLLCALYPGWAPWV